MFTKRSERRSPCGEPSLVLVVTPFSMTPAFRHFLPRHPFVTDLVLQQCLPQLVVQRVEILGQVHFHCVGVALPLANSFYRQVCRGPSPPSDCPCRAHEKRPDTAVCRVWPDLFCGITPPSASPSRPARCRTDPEHPGWGRGRTCPHRPLSAGRWGPWSSRRTESPDSPPQRPPLP